MRAERQTVRHMRVRGPSRTSVMRLVPEIEDALATTSWPGQSNGRSAATVLQIRRLVLPRVGAGTGRFAIARLIEAQIAQGDLKFASAGMFPLTTDWILWPNRTEMLVGAAVASVSNGPGGAVWWQTAGVPAGAAPVTPEDFAKAVLRFSPPGGPDQVPGALLRLIDVMPQPHLRHWLTPVLKLWRAARPLPPDTRDVAVLSSQMAAVQVRRGLPPPKDTEIMLRVLVSAVDGAAGLPPAVRAKLIAVLRYGGIAPAAQIWLVAQALIAHTAPAAQHQVFRTLRDALMWSETDAPPELPGADLPDADCIPVARARSEPAPVNAPAVPQDLAGRGTVAGDPVAGPAVAHPRTDEMTRLGGLVVLMNMLGHLHIPLADQKAGSDYAVQLLEAFAGRLAPDDILLQALPDAGPDPVGWLRDRHVPVFRPTLTWLNMKRPLSVHRMKGRRGRVALCFPGGRLCVGILDATQLQGLRGTVALRRGTVLDLSDAELHQRLRGGLSVLVQHSLRTAGAGPWRAVLQRAGYVIHSLTHLDVTLDLEDIRLNERRLGLDASPGWLPWLGRVVSLHFERFDRPHMKSGARDE